MRVLALMLACVVLAGVGCRGSGSPVAQASSETPPPIAVSASEADDHIALTLTNHSPKPIAAYAVILGLTETGGRLNMKAVHTILVGSPRDNFSKVRNAGESWTERSATFTRKGKALTNKTLRIAPTVDYVQFADGSSWGPDKEKRSIFLQGLRVGASSEFGYYAQVLRQSGADTLAREISQVALPGAPPKLPGELITR